MAESSWRRYLRFWRPNVEADVDDELRFHFEERIDVLVAAGLEREEARRQAEGEFGDVGAVRNGLREIDRRLHASRRRIDRWDQWRQDFAYSARSLRRVPGLSLTVIVTLALGIGVNATLFSLLDRVFLRTPAAVSRPNELRRFYWMGTSVNNQAIAVPEFSIPIAEGVSDALRGMAVTTVFRSDTRRRSRRRASHRVAALRRGPARSVGVGDGGCCSRTRRDGGGSDPGVAGEPHGSARGDSRGLSAGGG